MSQRKLQQEMERVFKRVSEGVIVFDGIYDKLQMSTNPSQRDKLESDLKREIKKLQRLRDQIKTWMGSNEVKDKKQLTENRKLIETEMERFKVTEKEMKTKSKDRAADYEQLDPREKERRDTSDFLATMIEELERQVEELEAEEESLDSTLKKGRRDAAKSERISAIDHTLERHRWHVEKMELMQRMLEAGSLQADPVNALQDDIRYYVESNQEADFAEDEEIYDELNLVEDEDFIPEDTGLDEPGYSLDDLAESNPPPSTATAPATSSAATAPSTTTTAASVPSSAPSGTKTANVLDKKRAPGSAGTKPLARVDSRPALAPISPKNIPQGLSPLPAPSAASAVAAAAAAATTATAPATAPAAATIATPAPSTTAHPAAAKTLAVDVAASAALWTEKAREEQSKLEARRAAQETTRVTPINLTLPPGLKELVGSLDAARQRVGAPPPLSSISSLLESAYLHCPDVLVTEKPRHYHPESPFPTPSYYPQEPLEGLDSAAVLSKMDVDTLFYIFYYRQGTYHQYLAARELKNRSWRFHRRFLTWFQRHEEPKAINNDYEQGTYRYFDFEGLWLQRRKSNFKFEYQFLEDEI